MSSLSAIPNDFSLLLFFLPANVIRLSVGSSCACVSCCSLAEESRCWSVGQFDSFFPSRIWAWIMPKALSVNSFKSFLQTRIFRASRDWLGRSAQGHRPLSCHFQFVCHKPVQQWVAIPQSRNFYVGWSSQRQQKQCRPSRLRSITPSPAAREVSLRQTRRT